MMNEYATFRRIRREDFQTLEDIENRSFFRPDPDFGVRTVHQDAWDRHDIEAAVFGENKTQGFVVEEGVGNIVAYYVFEVEAEAYRIRRLIVHPDYRAAGFGRTILWRMHQKIVKSAKRKTVTARVSERDLETCRWMTHMGFAPKLVRGGWDDENDGIEFTFTTETNESAIVEAAGESEA